MKSFFQDEYINTKVLSRLTKEIEKEQLDTAIEEIGYLNELQERVISRCDFMSDKNAKLDLIKKINNAGRKNIQI